MAGVTLGAGTAFAGTMAAPVMDKNPVLAPENCYQAGELVVKPFFNVTIFDKVGDHGDWGRDDYYGGGLALDYFLTDRIGLGLEGSWIDTPSVLQNYNVNLTYRLTDPANCLSLYGLVGGGVFANGSAVGAFHVGGGVEYRFTHNMGAFVDGRYTWIDGGDVTAAVIRAGLSFKF